MRLNLNREPCLGSSGLRQEAGRVSAEGAPVPRMSACDDPARRQWSHRAPGSPSTLRRHLPDRRFKLSVARTCRHCARTPDKVQHPTCAHPSAPRRDGRRWRCRSHSRLTAHPARLRNFTSALLGKRTSAFTHRPSLWSASGRADLKALADRPTTCQCHVVQRRGPAVSASVAGCPVYRNWTSLRSEQPSV